MSSLGFDLLDRHVILGAGDVIASADATGELSYADLLGRSAALAGGLSAMGVRLDHEIAIDVPPGNILAMAVCASVRLGAVPVADGPAGIRQIDEQVMVRVGEYEESFETLLRAGAADPAAALEKDSEGFRERVEASFGLIIETLLDGGTIS